MSKIRVAIIGTGNIGADLCERMLLDSSFEVVALIGRRKDSPGLLRFKDRITNLMPDGIEDLKLIINEVDGVFDATSAHSHLEHWEVAEKANKWMVDLTPSKIGTPIVPQLIDYIPSMFMNGAMSQNFSMITCGGQSGAPLAFALSRSVGRIYSLEISSSIAALSAGPATRDNIDQYIESTENLMTLVSGVEKVKAILVLNPADPPVMMRTTVTLAADSINLEAAQSGLSVIVDQTMKYVPGYEVTVEPHSPKPGIVSATVKVRGAGYYLPSYAGNLDIINAAAVQTAKIHMNEIDAVSSRRIR